MNQSSVKLGQRYIPFDQLKQYDLLQHKVPPNETETYLPIQGKLTMLLKLDYLNLPFDKEFQYRYSLWGQKEKVYFDDFVSQMKITANINSLSKYLFDMNILCIEVVSILASAQRNLLSNKEKVNMNLAQYKKISKQTEKGTDKEKRVIGYIYIPLRKYFISHCMNPFNEKFPIVDMNKKKLGQVGVQLLIQMLESRQNLNLNFQESYPGDSRRSRPYTQTDNSHDSRRSGNKEGIIKTSSNRNRSPSNFNSRKNHIVSIADDIGNDSLDGRNTIQNLKYRQVNKQLVDDKYGKKNYFHHQNLQKGGDSQNQQQIVDEINRNEYLSQKKNKKQKQTRSKQNMQMKNSSHYYQQKEGHTDLSLIRMKWGNNHPSVELMKLRLDEVKYLNMSEDEAYKPYQYISNQQKNEKSFQIKLMLKTISPYLGRLSQQFLSVPISLTMVPSSSHRALTTTKIFPQNLETLQNKNKNISSQTLLINYLLILNDVSIEMNDILRVQTAETFNQFTIKELITKTSLELRRKDNKKRHLQIKYQLVQHLNHDSDQINQKHGDNRNPQNIYKNRIKSPANSPKSNKSSNNFNKPAPSVPNKNKQNIIQEQQKPEDIFNSKFISNISRQQLLKEMFQLFQKLAQSQDEQCYECVMDLLSESDLNSKLEGGNILNQRKYSNKETTTKYLKLESILNAASNSKSKGCLQQIILQIFNSSFKSFYKSFEEYKQINEKYQICLYKLTKILSLSNIADVNNNNIDAKSQTMMKSYHQGQHSHSNQVSPLRMIQKVIQHLKKYKKQLVNFGLIKRQDLCHLILEKTKLDGAVLKCIESFLILFERYPHGQIKLSQIYSFIVDFIEKGRYALNANIGIFIKLYIETLHQQQFNAEDMGDQIQREVKKQFLSTQIFKLLVSNENHLKPLKNVMKNKQSELKPKENAQTNLILCNLIFSDPLSLEDLKSSIHFTQSNQHQVSENQNQHLRTETQGIEQRQRRLRTQTHNQDKKRIHTGGTERLRTEEINQGINLRGNNHKNRLNTEEQNVVDIFNNNSSGKLNKQKQTKQKKQQQEIQIQFTKKEVFFENISAKEDKEVNNQRIDNKDKNQQQNEENTPRTKLIRVKFNVELLHSDNSNKENQQRQIGSLFYDCFSEGNSQAFKLKSRNHENVVPNSLDKIIQDFQQDKDNKDNRDNQSVNSGYSKYLKIRIQNASFKNYSHNFQKSSKSKGIQLAIRNKQGKEQYPIQNQQGQTVAILMIDISQIDSKQEEEYLNSVKEIEQAKVNQENQEQYRDVWILNLNRILSVDEFMLNKQDKNQQYRITYQVEGQQYLSIRQWSINQIENQSMKNKCPKRVLDFRGIQSFKLNHKSAQNSKHTLIIQKIKTHGPEIKSKTFLQLNSRRNMTQKQISNLNIEVNSNEVSEIICQFQFKIDNTHKFKIQEQEFGIVKQNIWLINGKYRADVDIFRVQYQKWEEADQEEKSMNMSEQRKNIQNKNSRLWNEKIFKILKVFEGEKLKIIQNLWKTKYMKQNEQPKMQQIIQILYDVMDYRLTQIEILKGIIFRNAQLEKQLSVKQKLDYLSYLFGLEILQKNKLKKEGCLISLIFSQFQTFDLEGHGFLSEIKSQVVKKVVPQINAINFDDFFIGAFISQNIQKQEGSLLNINMPLILDLNARQRKPQKRIIDYIKLLWKLKEDSKCQDDFFEHQQVEEQKNFNKKSPQKQKNKTQNNPHLNQKKQNNSDSYCRLTLKQFKDLKLGDSPCTLQFRIDNQVLADAIYRSYSHNFKNKNRYIVVPISSSNQSLPLNIFNRQVNYKSLHNKGEMYVYQLVETIQLYDQFSSLLSSHQSKIEIVLKCDRLQGTIVLEMENVSKDEFQHFKKNQYQKTKMNLLQYQGETNVKIIQEQQYSVQALQNIQNQAQKQKQIVNNLDKSLLRKQFYEQQLQKTPSKETKKDVRKYSPVKIIEDSLKLQESRRLNQTRKQWQQMVSNKVDQNDKSIYSILKSQLNAKELDDKFNRPLSDDSDSNESNE